MADLTPEQQQRANQIKVFKQTANAEQTKVIEYFEPGCAFGGTKDADFDQIVSARRGSLNTRQMALNKIGLDEDELNEIPDVSFEGFQLDYWQNGRLDGFSKAGADQRWRTGKYAITHLFFSSTQVYMYKYTFSLYNNDREERTEEYFYKDITNFSTTMESISAYVAGNGCSNGDMKTSTVNTQHFALVVPGDKFSCYTQMDIEQSVQAMKAKLREMKLV